MKEVTAYTDGACSGNPGPGGWGAVLCCARPAAEKELSGGEAATTNNRMELTAVVRALGALNETCKVTVVTDSRYVADAFRQGWLARWLRNGWRTADKKPVKNEDLWRALLAETERHEVHWTWIKGHAGHPENERADALAVAACQCFKTRSSSAPSARQGAHHGSSPFGGQGGGFRCRSD